MSAAQVAGGATTATLRYDPLGRLYETTGAAGGITRFLYDGDALVAEYNDAGGMTNRYVHGVGGADRPYVWYTGSTVSAATRHHLFANHQGSISLITNATGFTVVNINAYDDWGIPKGAATATATDDNIGRFQYTGQIWLPELGMYYYKARIYSPTLGRFMQTDPIGYEDQINLYAYVGNDPVNMIDPSGTRGRKGTVVNVNYWEAQGSSPTSTGHVSITRPETNETLVSSWPEKGTIRGAIDVSGLNDDPDHKETIALEGGRLPDKVIKVFVPDSLEFKRVAKEEMDKDYWSLMISGDNETNCLTASENALIAGGVEIGTSTFPSGLIEELEDLPVNENGIRIPKK